MKNVWKLVVGLVLLAALYYLIGITRVIEKIASVNPFFVILAAALLVFSLVLSGLNVLISVWPFRKISFSKAVKYYFFSWSVGFLGPGKVGDFSIIPLLQKDGITAGQATASAILNKTTTVFTLFFLSAFGVLFFFEPSYAFQLILAGVAILAVFVFLVWTPMGRSWIKKILGKKSAWFAGFGIAMDSYFSKHRDIVILNELVTVAQWLTLAVFTLALFWGFGFFPSFWDVVFVACISSVVSLIPISPNGIGVREVTYTFLAGLAGWPAVTTVSVIAVSLAIHYAIVVVTFVFFAGEIKGILKIQGPENGGA
ncbi:MAG: lysylphosphatidylglycerol synthase transmembrane domain-containing protein [Candidatus Micrarchaeota archaeon]